MTMLSAAGPQWLSAWETHVSGRGSTFDADTTERNKASVWGVAGQSAHPSRARQSPTTGSTAR
ncbi:MAG: hypothetical protein ACK4F8_11825 [Aquabacterium sp.]